MILYFSGTGNSRYIAECFADKLNDKVENITIFNSYDEVHDIITNQTGKSLGFVFPVHAWGVPPIMIDFINGIADRTFSFIRDNRIPVWMTTTCGDETGNAHIMFIKTLKNRDIDVAGSWSVIMPNTYVLLPGFDVDSNEIREKKIADAPDKIKYIANKIKKHEWEINVPRGSFPRIKTNLIYPLFKKWGIFPAKWRLNNNRCIGCGACINVCPVKNISISDSRPRWGKRCISCLACYHACKRHAIEYGNITKNKGLYSIDLRPKL